MAVFADAHAGDIDRRGVDQPLQPVALRRKIRRLAIDLYESAQRGRQRAGEALAQIGAETGAVRDRQPHVLIQMKRRDLRPRDVGRLRQRLQKTELAGAGRHDQPGLAALVHGLPERRRRIRRRRARHLFRIPRNINGHNVLPRVPYRFLWAVSMASFGKNVQKRLQRVLR